MKNLTAFFAFLLLTGSAFAQSITGTVNDGKSHQPLSYANITLLNAKDSTLIKATLSTDNGTFKFDNLKNVRYLVSAQMVGYVRQIIAASAVVTIELQPDTKQLGEVTIKALKPLVEHHTDRLVFNVENSIVAAGNNGLDLIKMTPLVTTGPDNSITIKGKTNVMIMIDGKIVPGGVNVIQNMPGEQIARIEVITNPSAKYDAAAAGGIINIVTKKGTGQGLNGSAQLSASQGRYGRYTGAVNLNYRKDKFNVYGNLDFYDGKSYKNESLTRFLTANGQPLTLQTPTELFGKSHSESGKAGVDYTINPNSSVGLSVEGTFYQSDNRAKATSYFSSNKPDSILTSNSQPGGNGNYLLYDLYYQNKLSPKGEQLNIDLNETHYSGLTKQDVQAQMVDLTGVNPVENSSTDTRTNAVFNVSVAQADYSLPLDSTTKFETGIKDLYTTSNNRSANMEVNSLTDNPAVSTTAYKENIAAGYISLSKSIKDLKLQAGLRAEQTNASLSGTGLKENYLNFFPGALIENKFSNNYDLSLSYAARIYRPDYEALIPFFIPIDRYTQNIGNPNLKPEMSQNFELTNTIHNVSVTLGYTYTKNAITDFIEQDEQTKVWTFLKANFNSVQNYNASVVLPITISKWWNSNNTVMGLYNNYNGSNVGGQDYNHGKFSYNLNSINTFTLPKGIKAEVTGIYNSSSLYGLYQISHYSMVNAGVAKTFFAKKLNVKVGMNDIFNDSGYKLKTDAGNLHLASSHYTDSRKITLSLSYKFGGNVKPARNSDHDDVRSRLGI